ncbi:hypothetical protein RM545_06090 [Zunongwangia sp. F260]|uniref:Uncharacterized protein n=1 Tax=Autumnicola lenta TaxID=3075593 RepID=A0ABU3CIS2_9FLAO|nr:hypothetical protein [Zunongwangia sp. F260]MDT0646253.1 hypothetical protein [Zunongwangia sp. F260]
MKIAILSIALILTLTTVKAQNLNEYKYVVVPESFGFLDTPNEYQLNALTKFLFEKNGFKTLMKSEQKPFDLEANVCLGLYANVEEDSNLFVTKLVVLLENCNGEVVFRTEEGTSREKEFKAAHHEALREAFKSLEEIEYKYAEKDAETSGKDAITAVAAVRGEVVTEIPGENPQIAVESEQEDEEIEEEVTGNEVTEENGDYYVLDNAVYFLEESNSGFSFFQKGMAEPFASLIKSEGQDSFIYSSITKQGLAYFDTEGNLVVEYFDKNRNEMIKTVYRIQD